MRLDQLRHDLQHRLDELLAEADKLRHALTALGSKEHGAATSAAASGRSRRATGSAQTSRTPTRRSARSSQAAESITATGSSSPAEAEATTPATTTTRTRTARGATKTAVLAALQGGAAMTAGEVANATGLGRSSVSTTLSKLAKSGEVTKAARGYQIAGQTTPDGAASTAK